MENLNESHVIHLSNSKEYEDEIVVLKEEKLKEEYRTPINQIWECTHGPGTRPDYKSSDTVHIKHIIDKDRMAVGRCDILGIIKPDVWTWR